MNLDQYSDLQLFKAAVGDDPDAAIKLASELHGVDEGLTRTVELQESGGNQRAISPKGAIGRMQLMSNTAKELQVNPHDEIENIWGGTKYLSQQIQRFGNIPDALGAYNWGPDRIDKLGLRRAPTETRGYVGNILNALGWPIEAQAGGKNLSKYSDEELMKIAGVSPEKIDISGLSDEELAKAAGVELPAGYIPGQITVDATSQTLSQFAEPAGELVGKVLDFPRKILSDALQLGYGSTFEKVRPESLKLFQDVLENDAFKLMPPEAYAPLPTAYEFGEAASTVIAPYTTYRLFGWVLGRAARLAEKGMYKYAPDIIFKDTAQTGLPAIIKPMTEGEMARWNEYTYARMMAERGAPVSSPIMTVPERLQTPALPIPRGVGEGFTMAEAMPVTRLKKPPAPVWETGEYPEVWEKYRNYLQMTAETALKRMGYDDAQIGQIMGQMAKIEEELPKPTPPAPRAVEIPPPGVPPSPEMPPTAPGPTIAEVKPGARVPLVAPEPPPVAPVPEPGVVAAPEGKGGPVVSGKIRQPIELSEKELSDLSRLEDKIADRYQDLTDKEYNILINLREKGAFIESQKSKIALEDGYQETLTEVQQGHNRLRYSLVEYGKSLNKPIDEVANDLRKSGIPEEDVVGAIKSIYGSEPISPVTEKVGRGASLKTKTELQNEIRLLESQRKSKAGYYQSQAEQKRINREIDNLRAQMPEDLGANYRSLLTRYRKYRKGPEEGIKYGQDETQYSDYKKTFAQDLINAAEKAGEPIPKEVLADYPDLAEKGGPGKKMYGGGPDYEYLKNLVSTASESSKDIKGKYQEYFPKVNSEDMTYIGKLVARLPSWKAKTDPDINRIWNISKNLRIELPSQIRRSAFKTLEPLYAIADNPPMLKKWRDYMIEGDAINQTELPLKEQQEAFDKLIERIKAEGPKEAAEAFFAWHRFENDSWNLIIKRLAAKGLPKSEIDEARREMGRLVGYIPHSWPEGKYYIHALDSEGNTLERATAKNRYELGKSIKELKDKHPGAVIDKGINRGLPEELFFALNPVHAQKLAQVAVERAGLGVEYKDRMIQALADSFKARGFGKHFIQRKNIPGYITEPEELLRVITDHVNAYAGFVGKLEASPRYMQALADIDVKAKPNTYVFAENYVRDVLRNANRTDRALGKVRNLMYLKYIAGVPSTATLNLSQNLTTFAPYMGLYTKLAYPKTAIAMKDIVKEGGAYWDFIHGRKPAWKNLTDEEARALDTMLGNGFFDAELTRELIGIHLGSAGKVMNAFNTAMDFMFGNAEKYNRVSSGLMAFRVFRNEHKLSFEDAVAKASTAIDDTHYAYGKYNLPEIARTGAAGRAFRSTGYVFKQFVHNYFEMLYHLTKQPGGLKVIGKSVATMALLGGVVAMPFIGSGIALYRKLTGKDPIQELFKKVDKTKNIAYTLFRFGLPGLLGVDFSAPIAVQLPGEYSRTIGEFATDVVLGPPGRILATELPSAYKQYMRGQPMRALEEIAPRFAKQPMRTYREATEGITTARGRPVSDVITGKPIKLTWKEALLKAGGYTPTRTTVQREISSQLKRLEETRRNKLDELTTRYANAVKSKDKDEQKIILKEWHDYNKKARALKEPIIDMKSWNAAVKSRQKPTKLPQYMQPTRREYMPGGKQ